MGRSRNVTFTVTYKVAQPFALTPSEWKTKVQGRPSIENLKKDVAHFEASTLPGGCNEHLGPLKVTRAYITRCSINEIIVDVTF